MCSFHIYIYTVCMHFKQLQVTHSHVLYKWRRTHTWWDVLVGPLKETTLLLSWFPTSVKHTAFIGPILHHCSGHGRFITVTHGIPSVSSTRPSVSKPLICVAKPKRRPRRLRGRSRRLAPPCGLPRSLVTLLICPEEEITVPRVALVELPTLIGTFLAHS